MIKTILSIDGMHCGMCESHVNDVIRNNEKIKKVSSSHVKGETEIISEKEIDVDNITAKLGEMGYIVNGAKTEPYEKKGFFKLFKK